MRLVFENFEIDQDGSRLVRGDVEVPLERRTLDLLCYLAEHPDRLIGKDELIARVWNANVLSDNVLSNTVAKLRKALGQGARDREPIETVHGRGYRFRARPKSQRTVDMAALPARTEPFVGRRSSITQLDAALTEVAHGTGRLVLISGEPGIGKSRMLDELASRAVARDFHAWRGVAYAGGAAPAYWPWVEILRAVLAEPALRRHLPADAWAVATLVPELLEARARSDDTHALRFRLFDEVTRWFAAASAERPCVIVIDDLQWADVSSIELLDHVARGLARQRVLLAAAVRDDAVLASGSVTREVQALRRLFRAAVHIELRGLAPNEVSELVVAVAAEDADGRSAELIHALTQGNPFFVRQVLQLLAQRGRPLTAASLEGAELPVAVREVIQQRLVGLPPEGRALLRAAAAISQRFDVALLARATRKASAEVLPALEPALRLGLIRRHDGTHRFDFNHALVRDSLYDELSLAERGELHALLARALAEHAPASDAYLLGEIARHSLLAVPCDVEAAVRHCCRAADAAREASGFEAAIAFLTRALERLAAEGGYAELRCEVLHLISLDHFCVGELELGRRALEDGARLASEIGATAWLARHVSRLVSWLDTGGHPRELLAWVDRALEQMDPAEDLYAALLARKAELNPELGPAERRGLYAEAERLAAATGVPEVMLEVAVSRAFQRDPTQLEECRAAVAAYRALEAQYPRALLGIQQRVRRCGVELTAYWAALVEGDVAAAQFALEACVAFAEASRAPHLRYRVDLLFVTRALCEGRLDDASVLIDRMRASGQFVGGFAMALWYCAALLAEAKNDLGMLAQLGANASFSQVDGVASRNMMGVLAASAALAGRMGHLDLARLLLSRLPNAELERMPSAYDDLGSLCSLVEAYVALGDRSHVDLLYAKLEPYASRNAVGIGYEYKGSVAHYLGLLALQRDRPDLAVRHFEAAIAFNEKLGMRTQVARGRELLARAAAAC